MLQGNLRLNRLNHLGTFQDSNDETIKSVYASGKKIIEVTFIQNKSNQGVDVFCVPTHHYCNLGCTLCHLTKEGRQKSMEPIEPYHFLEALARTAFTKSKGIVLSSNENGKDEKVEFIGKEENGLKRSPNKKCLVSYMGVGEPLLNLELISSVYEEEGLLKKICCYESFSYAIATMMPNAGLEKLTAIVTGKSIPLKVHFSLHSPFSDERKLLLPRTTVGVEEAFEMLAHYRKEVSGIESIQAKMKEFHAIADPTEIHYTLIDQVNDTDRHLKRMIELLDLYRIPLKLIRFNPPEGMQRSKKEGEWLSTLQKSLPGLRVVEYEPPGKQIGSSCGEFTKHYYLSELETEEEKKEFLEWKQEHQIFE